MSLAAALLLAAAPALFFDDFSTLPALHAAGWTQRSERGHPGIPGAAWGGVSLIDDPALAGNRLLRLTASTDGTPAGTQQAQLCQQRKFFRGTYAARVRFSDLPTEGDRGDPVVQAFYAVAPLRFDFDPEFSEVDFEYLPGGGWGSDATRLYAISWQTARIEPWLAYNQAFEAPGSHAGWHVLMVHVAAGHTEHFIDGRPLARHAGRNVPVSPMSINVSLWFSPGGLRPASAQARVYTQDVDWVLHVADALLPPAEVASRVALLRAGRALHADTVSAPVLAAACNF